MDGDEMIMVEGVVEVFDQTWWHACRGPLQRRFKQEAIPARSLLIEMLSRNRREVTA